MNFIRALYKTVIDALFPLSEVEEALVTLSPEEALIQLPPAPAYDVSVVAISGTRSLFAYKDERVSKLIWGIKYKKAPHSVAIGGFALYEALKKLASESAGPLTPIVIIPMPITQRRRRERGYNQCELLLDEVQRLDVDHQFVYKNDLLTRAQHASRQTLKGRDERLESSKGIFDVKKDTVAKISSKDVPIVIIDDVITTGSTMKEALDVLHAAGFSDVRGLSLAH